MEPVALAHDATADVIVVGGGGAGLAAMKREASPTVLGERFEYIETFPGYVACVCTHTDDALAPVRRFTLGDIT